MTDPSKLMVAELSARKVIFGVAVLGANLYAPKETFPVPARRIGVSAEAVDGVRSSALPFWYAAPTNAVVLSAIVTAIAIPAVELAEEPPVEFESVIGVF
ncbi:MAG TPA: hypothetical protein VFI61_02250 [Patescibacteria group bacterium]|nr:hypothetical protein [Patescibacteria group bacterium]